MAVHTARVGTTEPIAKNLQLKELKFLEDPEKLIGRYVKRIMIDGTDRFPLPEKTKFGDSAFQGTQAYYMLTEFCEQFESLAPPGKFKMKPVTLEFTESYVRSQDNLPLSLEPDIDYNTWTIRFSRSLQLNRLVHSSILLHEAAHVTIAQLIEPDIQVAWLSEAVCDYLSASFLNSPKIVLVGKYPELGARILDNKLRLPKDLKSRLDWMKQFHEQLSKTDIPKTHPEILEQFNTLMERLSEQPSTQTTTQPHSVGLVVGGFLWSLGIVIGTKNLWKIVLSSELGTEEGKHKNVQEWFHSLVRADFRLFEGSHQKTMVSLASQRGIQ